MDKNTNNQNEKELELNEEEMKNVSGGFFGNLCTPVNNGILNQNNPDKSENKSDKKKSSPDLSCFLWLTGHK